jgi:hypothetical protein
MAMISACSVPRTGVGLTETAAPRDAAEDLIETLKCANSELKSYKGIGKLTLDYDSNLQSSRIAWIGSTPGMLRVEILGPAGGPPLASIASDGDWFYIVAHQEGRFIKKRSNQASLKRLIHLPIDPLDIYDLLAGRIPIHPYGTARLIASESAAASDADGGENASQRILVLKPKWRQHPSQKIYFEKDRDRVHRIEFFDRTGKLLYRADIQKIENVDGYQIPMTIIFSDDRSSARIAIDRFWTGAAVLPSVFQLAPPSAPK